MSPHLENDCQPKRSYWERGGGGTLTRASYHVIIHVKVILKCDKVANLTYIGLQDVFRFRSGLGKS